MKTTEQNSKSQIDVGEFLRMSERQNRSRRVPEDIDLGKFFRIAESRSNRIVRKNIHEIREKMKKSKGFDLVGNIKINGISKKN